MIDDVVIPNFGELLAGHLGQLPPETIPGLLAELERNAGERYREWAEEFPGAAEGLLACADREDDIAARVGALFPISTENQSLVDQVVPGAVGVFLQVFDGLAPLGQITIQANAERQGAAAWRGMVSAYPQAAEDLESLAKTEEANADFLDDFLANHADAR